MRSTLRKQLVSTLPRPVRLWRRALRAKWRACPIQDLSEEHYNIELSPELLEHLKTLHAQRPASIFIHGIQQRSGTNFVGDLLNLHPDIHGFPAKTWEIPLLQKVHRLVDFQDHYIERFQRNAQFIGKIDFVPLMAESLVEYLATQAPEHKTLLFKDPSVRHIALFHKAFPLDNLVLVVRDGRDVISSRLRTWPHIDFQDAVHEWDIAAQSVLTFLERHQQSDKVLFERYEEIAQAPEAFATRALDKFGLDKDHYPFDAVASMPLKGSSRVRGNNADVHWKEEAKPADFKASGNWCHWSQRQIRYFNKIAGDSSEALGYGL